MYLDKMVIGDNCLYLKDIKNWYIISVRNIEGWNLSGHPVSWNTLHNKVSLLHKQFIGYLHKGCLHFWLNLTQYAMIILNMIAKNVNKTYGYAGSILQRYRIYFFHIPSCKAMEFSPIQAKLAVLPT